MGGWNLLYYTGNDTSYRRIYETFNPAGEFESWLSHGYFALSVTGRSIGLDRSAAHYRYRMGCGSATEGDRLLYRMVLLNPLAGVQYNTYEADHGGTVPIPSFRSLRFAIRDTLFKSKK